MLALFTNIFVGWRHSCISSIRDLHSLINKIGGDSVLCVAEISKNVVVIVYA